jgi:glycerate dehydrogenase
MVAKVVVTYEPEDDERRAIKDGLEGLVKTIYLKDADENNRNQLLREADVILSISFSSKEIVREEIPQISNVKLIQLVFAGADNVPFKLLPERVTIACNSGAFAEPLAEHVLAMVLALAKSLVLKHELLKEGIFNQTGLNKYLKGCVCGIIGLGGNGMAVAKIMRALGLRIYAVDVSPSPKIEVDFFGSPQENLLEVLRDSEVVVLTVPLTRQTRGMIGREELNEMKKDAILINVARGEVIEQEALYKHLLENREFKVGIDTWWEEPVIHGAFRLKYPFFNLPNVIGSPHIADMVPGTMLTATKLAVENIKNHLRGKKIQGVLNRLDYLE